jgi:hypothetical protein
MHSLERSLPRATTGVGKTELAKALAAYLFNTEDALVGGHTSGMRKGGARQARADEWPSWWVVELACHYVVSSHAH